MKKVVIYHNPRCSKSRQTLEILQQKDLDITIVKYLETPPSVGELDKILKILGKQPREVMRKNESQYKDNDMGNDKHSREDLIALMHEFPKVIERPIVVCGQKVAIGRPPESVLKIL